MQIKTSRSNIVIFIASIVLILLFLIDFINHVFLYGGKTQNIVVTQAVEKNNVDKNQKLFLDIEYVRQWQESNKAYGAIYNCTFYNNMKTNFKDWNIRLRLPNDIILVSYWNANVTLNDGVLKIEPSQTDTLIKPNSKLSFSFVLGAPDPLDFSTVTISGISEIAYAHSSQHLILLLMIAVDMTAIIIFMLVHSMMQKKINQLKAQKERDDLLLDQIMKTFVNFIDAKDEYTRGHSTRVGLYSRAIAAKLGYSAEGQQDMYYMGLMHDIGKMTIPDEILNKTSHLSSEEWEIIQMHTTNGANLLKDFTIMPSLIDAVLYHHERYDGKGYVNNLKGEEIPVAARIICVADSFDAMNTNRCYRLRYSKDRIIQELERCSGKQFDPVIAKAMIELIKNGTITKIDQDYYMNQV